MKPENLKHVELVQNHQTIEFIRTRRKEILSLIISGVMYFVGFVIVWHFYGDKFVLAIVLFQAADAINNEERSSKCSRQSILRKNILNQLVA